MATNKLATKERKPAPKRQSSIHDDFASRQNAILTAALGEFCSAGYAATSINSIASSVGVSAGLLYKHFDSKEHLLYEAIAFQYSEDIQKLINEVSQVEGAWKKLRLFVRLHLSSWRDTPDFNLLFFHETRRPTHKYSRIVREHARIYVRCLEDILEEGIKSGDFSPNISVRFIRDFLIGGLDHSVWASAATGRRIDVDALSDQAMAYLLPNILAHPRQVEDGA